MHTANIRGSRLSSRPFYTTVLLLTLLTAYSFLAKTQFAPTQSRRDGTANLGHVLRRNDEPHCREVQSASNQCAFVKKYCVDDSAGLLPYLEFYYCALGRAQPVAFVVLVLWLSLLFTTIGIAASDFFSVNLSTIASILGLSESLAGVTFLALGNGSPDVFSTFAAMGSNSASMAVGELIGAASFITGVVAGSMALVREFRVDRKTYARDICFFIVAVSFTMVFLADGELRFWECCIMIGYYVVYVVTVVTLHWYSKRRQQRQRREGEARSHVYGLVSGDDLEGEPYHDVDDVDPREARLQVSGSTPAVIDHGPRIEVEGQQIENGWGKVGAGDEDHDMLVAAEVASSMRILRTGSKRSYHGKTPIRPSLLGALEFRSALAQLQREGNLQLSPIPGRSRSETHLHHRSRRRTVGPVLNSEDAGEHLRLDTTGGGATRDRALSTGHTPVSSAVPPELTWLDPSQGPSGSSLHQDPSGSRRAASPASSHKIGGHLAPPLMISPEPSLDVPGTEPRRSGNTPSLNLQIPTQGSSFSDPSPPASPFPRYTDSPMVLTPNEHTDQAEFFSPTPAMRDVSFGGVQPISDDPRPIAWWPYSMLPPPHVILATLFPTLQGWREKTHWDRFVSAISIPSIFLLVITLPVVESETFETDSEVDAVLDAHSPVDMGHVAPPVSIEPAQIEPEDEWERYRRHTLQRSHSHRSSLRASPNLIPIDPEETAVERLGPSEVGPLSGAKTVSPIPSISNANDETSSWNRWLVCVQLFTGPLFAVFILWANISEDWEERGKELAKMMLYTLIVSLVLLGVMLLYTSERTRPKHHYVLCFLGFIISVAWISTIAEEVVGVLKLFGVVLGISEGLLGLTIFAAGNSVGDLVADITVARLGYPVMAL